MVELFVINSPFNVNENLKLKGSCQNEKIRFGEAITILVVMLIILGTSVIKFGLSPQIPVLFVIALIMFWAKPAEPAGMTFIRESKMGLEPPLFQSLSSS